MGGEPEVTDFSPSQQVALAIVPKFTAFLSIIGSGWIIFEVSRSRRKLRLVYHRMMLEMSIGDMIVTIPTFLSTWPMPRGTPNVYGAVGTTGTCTAQGFFMQAGQITELFQAFLSAYFFVVLRCNWKERRLRTLEKTAVGFCATLSLGTSVAGIPLTLYNGANFWCWIAAFPSGCQDETSCTRGQNAYIYRYAFFYVWSWLAFFVIVVLMFLMFWTVHEQAERAKRYNAGGSLGNKRVQVGIHALTFILTFFVVNIFASMERIAQSSSGKTYFSLSLLMVIFTPLRGFFNLLIYLRPRYKRYRGVNPSWSARTVMKRVLLRAVRGQSPEEEGDDGDHKLGNMELDASGVSSAARN